MLYQHCLFSQYHHLACNTDSERAHGKKVTEPGLEARSAGVFNPGSPTPQFRFFFCETKTEREGKEGASSKSGWLGRITFGHTESRAQSALRRNKRSTHYVLRPPHYSPVSALSWGIWEWLCVKNWDRKCATHYNNETKNQLKKPSKRRVDNWAELKS